MSDPTGAVPAEGAPASESTSSEPDYAPVMDRLTELAGQVGELHSGFQQFQQAQQPPPEADPDPWTALFGEPDQDPNLAPEPQQPQLDPNALQAAMQQAIQQANAPLQQQLQALQMERATAQLYQQIPQLAQVPESHPDYAAHEAARTQTAQRVQQALASYPPEVAQILQNDPNYIATIFKAAEAESAARAQVPAGGDVPSLEAAGGAHPGGNGEQALPTDQIYGQVPAAMPKGFR